MKTAALSRLCHALRDAVGNAADALAKAERAEAIALASRNDEAARRALLACNQYAAAQAKNLADAFAALKEAGMTPLDRDKVAELLAHAKAGGPKLGGPPRCLEVIQGGNFRPISEADAARLPMARMESLQGPDDPKGAA